MSKRFILTILPCALFMGSAPQTATEPAAGLQTDSAAVIKPLTLLEKIRAKRLNIPLDPLKGDLAQQVLAMANEPYKNTDLEVRIHKVQKDRLGYTHVRLRQYYKGIQVDGAEKITHINKNNVLYDIDGTMSPKLAVDVVTKLTSSDAEEIALDDARGTVCTDNQCQKWKTATAARQDSLDALIAKGNAECRLVHVPSKIITGGTVAYLVEVRERGMANRQNRPFLAEFLRLL